MREIILVKYGEIILKGGNRSRFEKVLIQNIANAIKNIAETRITIMKMMPKSQEEEGQKVLLGAVN